MRACLYACDASVAMCAHFCALPAVCSFRMQVLNSFTSYYVFNCKSLSDFTAWLMESDLFGPDELEHLELYYLHSWQCSSLVVLAAAVLVVVVVVVIAGLQL